MEPPQKSTGCGLRGWRRYTILVALGAVVTFCGLSPFALEWTTDPSFTKEFVDVLQLAGWEGRGLVIDKAVHKIEFLEGENAQWLNLDGSASERLWSGPDKPTYSILPSNDVKQASVSLRASESMDIIEKPKLREKEDEGPSPSAHSLSAGARSSDAKEPDQMMSGPRPKASEGTKQSPAQRKKALKIQGKKSLRRKARREQKVALLLAKKLARVEKEKKDEQAAVLMAVSKPREQWRKLVLRDLRDAKRAIRDSTKEALPGEPDGRVYLNASLFRRTYREMIRRMKVFVYPDGRGPRVHTGPSTGIYYSETRVIRGLEDEIKSGVPQFVTNDPREAHLFFMPFSIAMCARTLVNTAEKEKRYALYRERMTEFMSTYLDGISTRYPYFNLSRGSDHFYVACHDWGAKTARFHKLIFHNAIKVVCNADSTTGDFLPGRDASLIEVNRQVFKVKPPPVRPMLHLRNRTILAFFAGQRVGRVRPALLDVWGAGRDPDVQVLERLTEEQAAEMSYKERMARARFCLCPAGYEVNSPRIVESMSYECVPVIIADAFVLPFSDVLNWDAFSVRITEADIPRIKEILSAITDEKYLQLQGGVKIVRKHFIFNKHSQPYDAFYMIMHSIWVRRLLAVDGEAPSQRTTLQSPV